MRVELTYFKSSGKYYGEGSFEIKDDLALYEIWGAVAAMKEHPELSGRWNEMILVNVPGHPHEHPHIIMGKNKSPT